MTSEQAYLAALLGCGLPDTHESKERRIEIENAIHKHSYYSYVYARHILEGRFALGEELVSKNSFYSYNYIKNILRYNHD